jgi:hypothetical protein
MKLEHELSCRLDELKFEKFYSTSTIQIAHIGQVRVYRMQWHGDWIYSIATGNKVWDHQCPLMAQAILYRVLGAKEEA